MGCVAQLDAEAVIEPQTTAQTVHNLLALGVALRSIVEELDHAERTYATHTGPEPVAAFVTLDQHQQRPSPRGAGAMRLNMQRVYTRRAVAVRRAAKKVTSVAMCGMNTTP